MAKKYNAKEFSQALRHLVKVPAQITGPASVQIKREILLNFDKGRDPYGNAHAPLKPSTIARGRHPPPLTDSGAGKRGITVKPAPGAGIRLESNVPYMRRHQLGAPKANLVSRPFFPTNVLPKRWAMRIQAEYDKQIKKVIG
jgi:hypothetical protein